MKAVLGFLATLVLFVGAVLLLSPDGGGTFRARLVGFLDSTPTASAEPAPPPPAPGLGPAAGGSGAAVPWREKDRAAWRAYEAGDFAAAAALWTEAAEKAPPADAPSLRGRADRAQVFRLLSEGAAEGPGSAADEAEYRRRLDAVSPPSAGAYLEVAAFAAEKGLRSHLAFLYEKAWERRHGSGGDAVPKSVTAAIRRGKGAGAPPPPVALEAVIRELPTSEAADLAREATGSGIGGVVRREEQAGGVDYGKLNEARDLMAKGDVEYRLAVPGSKEVNLHRKAALDLYTRARKLYEEVDGGRGTYAGPIHDLNRNIAELRKDLPIGVK